MFLSWIYSSPATTQAIKNPKKCVLKEIRKYGFILQKTSCICKYGNEGHLLTAGPSQDTSSPCPGKRNTCLL